MKQTTAVIIAIILVVIVVGALAVFNGWIPLTCEGSYKITAKAVDGGTFSTTQGWVTLSDGKEYLWNYGVRFTPYTTYDFTICGTSYGRPVIIKVEPSAIIGDGS